ncbi:MAG TPA: LacI family DNA-binding transcriptional regulator [Actinophytocola sp.]|jgi:LacI family transcriptional regulator|uniref:LacI family DNA-binding transcriptional regulator n=1 Tax=Actinophytocola sp. TaxID=1872138 RepID=UPI002DFCC640|nr:LacI family DNA-binding transcriptional regulator [Actinophytocola sp.]
MAGRRSRPVTLSDVAALAGVSVSTASKALNGREEVAAATRDRVLAAADKLSFQPAMVARGQSSGRTRTVGLISDEVAGRPTFPILLGVENALSDKEMSVLLCDTQSDPTRRQHYIRTLLAHPVDGFIVVGDGSNRRASLTRHIPVPVVYVYGESTDHRDLSVLADDTDGGRLATEHLVSLHRKHIAHVTGPPNNRAARDRAAALRTVLDEAWLALVGEPLFGEWSQTWGRHAAKMLATTYPNLDAIFCGNDQIAAGVAQALQNLGALIPDDIAIVGYDNWEVFAADCQPPLTTVDLNLQQLGTTAVTELLAALGGRQRHGVIRQPCRLVVRESTGPPPSFE